MHLSNSSPEEREKQLLSNLLGKYNVESKNGQLYIKKIQSSVVNTTMNCSDLMKKSQRKPAHMEINDVLAVVRQDRELTQSKIQQEKMVQEQKKLEFEQFTLDLSNECMQKGENLDFELLNQENTALRDILDELKNLDQNQKIKLQCLKDQLLTLQTQVKQIKQVNQSIDDKLNATRLEISVIVHERNEI